MVSFMENRKIREVDINEYLPVLIDIINTGNDVSLLKLQVLKLQIVQFL